MGIFNSVADKLSSETLGEIKNNNPVQKPVKPMKPMKAKKNVLIQPIQSEQPQNYQQNYQQDNQQYQQQYQQPINPSKKYPVLEMLGLDFEPNIVNLVTPEDIDNAAFDVSAPTGLNPDQVEQFCNKVQSDLAIYRNVIYDRQNAFILLLEQINSLTDKLVEHNQEQELANYIVDDNGQEVDRLKNELVNLRIENSELKSEISELKSQLINYQNRNFR